MIQNDKAFFKIYEISLAVYKLKFSRHFVKYSQICIKQLPMGNGRVTAKYELWLFRLWVVSPMSRGDSPSSSMSVHVRFKLRTITIIV